MFAFKKFIVTATKEASHNVIISRFRGQKQTQQTRPRHCQKGQDGRREWEFTRVRVQEPFTNLLEISL